ncbi:transcriptional regulator HexR [Aestuariirhabdus litorea]|uniref:Transcriptional regulator HexR n=1 Tax=Aestuariirhabdus litorea TaxID=2528527 RepID=A0A3P3VIL3_9GAMM|nr:transcriptional regulator HexR [Aestuariirhabdus litorea]RRJ82502.1 transcriptional regulator HexR [Aestuariirhabdus litorea]RWW92663.1 transcriptional regulator HexR [Endozoicomonadaceae bacterium GTF-13]
MTTKLLTDIELCLGSLRKSELKVAEQVLAQPSTIIHLSLAGLAAASRVSEPTVLRFCRAVGCNGFQDFKLQLAQSLAANRGFAQFDIDASDKTSDYKRKIFDSTIGTLVQTRDKLDPQALEDAIDPLAHAKRVEFYGYGASGAVASDAQHKFFRLQVATAAYSDPHMQAMSAATMQPGDVVVAISQTGRTRELMHSVRQVQERGAKVVGICPANTPLAELSDYPILIDVSEDTEVYTPLTSRIVHLVVIDILAMGVAMARGPELAEHLKTVKRNLRSLRLNPR